MRGDDEQSGHLFSYLSPEQRVPADRPLRAIRTMTDEALRRLSPRFETLYATTGRPSIPPEHLLRALLLQVLYAVRSGADADGAAAVQPAVPVVCRPRPRRRGLGADDLHEESRSAAGGRHRPGLL